MISAYLLHTEVKFMAIDLLYLYRGKMYEPFFRRSLPLIVCVCGCVSLNIVNIGCRFRRSICFSRSFAVRFISRIAHIFISGALFVL